MKKILISIRPEWAKLILEGKKKDEIRKTFPKCELPCEVFIYVTKEKDILLAYEEYDRDSMSYYGTQYALITRNPFIDGRKPPKKDDEDYRLYEAYREMYRHYSKGFKEEEGGHERILNGKVVAKFTLNKADEIENDRLWGTDNYFLERTCLSFGKLACYLSGKTGYAWHIDNLVIFDKPKELKEFYHSFCCKKHEWKFANNNVEVDSQYKALRQPIRGGYEYSYPLTKAPQSWCYVNEI